MTAEPEFAEVAAGAVMLSGADGLFAMTVGKGAETGLTGTGVLSAAGAVSTGVFSAGAGDGVVAWAGAGVNPPACNSSAITTLPCGARLFTLVLQRTNSHRKE
jgi:hypothetical protein